MRLLKFVPIFALAAVVCAPAFAQTNPLVGTWKLDVTKSTFDPGPGPKRLTRTVEAQGDGVKYTFDGVAADGNPLRTVSASNLTAKTIPSPVQFQAVQTPYPPSA
jgi:hypothetical protein